MKSAIKIILIVIIFTLFLGILSYWVITSGYLEMRGGINNIQKIGLKCDKTHGKFVSGYYGTHCWWKQDNTFSEAEKVLIDDGWKLVSTSSVSYEGESHKYSKDSYFINMTDYPNQSKTMGLELFKY